MIERRGTIPTGMEDPEDCTVTAEEEEVPEPPSSISPPKRKTVKDDLIKLPKEVRNLLAGGIAGMTAKSVVAPFDRIKILYQVSSAEFHLFAIPQVVRNIVQNEGLAALWKGNSATMIRVFPYSGIQFMVFDRIKSHFLKEHERIQYQQLSSTSSSLTNNSQPRRKWGLSPMESLVSGMCAGTISVILTYPLDLTRAQMAVRKRHKHTHNIGFVRVLAENYRQRGITGLFRGITPTLLGILPYSGIAFALNEQGKREIQHVTGRDLTTTERMQCGATAGLVAQTVTYPIEVTRRRMQTIGLVGSDTALNNLNGCSGKTTAQQAMSMGATVRALYQEQGLRGFFKGVSMNWMKGPIAFSISFTVFDTVQMFMESDSERTSRFQSRR